MFAKVAVYPLQDLLTYEIPACLQGNVEIGSKVVVPIGKGSERSGYIVEILNEKDADNLEIKEIKRQEIENEIFFNEDLLKVFKWLSSYYNVPISRVIDAGLVKYVKDKTKKIVLLKNENDEKIKGKSQEKAISILKENNNSVDYEILQKEIKNISQVLKSLVEKNVIEIKEEKLSFLDSVKKKTNEKACQQITLYDEQEKAVRIIGEDVANNKFNTYLLHGVTGSGKTEVYIELIKKAISQGRSAMLIVPEISLTPQLLDRFKQKVGENIAVLHSAVSPYMRYLSWQALLKKECNIIIGARSGVFAPISNLGVVIVDEEHDSSFKQSDSFRYNARDTAIIRAKFSNCPVVLGSATPSLETYYNAVVKKYRYLSLNKRYAKHQKINFEIVDLNKVKKKEMASEHISPALYNAIKENLENGNQAFILYNKRGFASVVQCQSCGDILKCPNCSISLVYHQHKNILMCHQCDFTARFDDECKFCKKEKLDHVDDKDFGKLILKGAGTEKVFDELKKLFPEANIERLDRDSVTTLKKYEEILNKVKNREVDILVGTQMIAKGHDIPSVNLVAIIDCDASLYFPDFRASERAYQLFTQVAGRAGRGEELGTCVLQTRNKDHIAIKETISANYLAFANAELRERKEMFYPPFSFLAHIIASNINSQIALNEIMAIRNMCLKYIEANNLCVNILGPAPCPISRISNLYRWHIILKSKTRKELNEVILFMDKLKKLEPKTKLIIDIDPQDML